MDGLKFGQPPKKVMQFKRIVIHLYADIDGLKPLQTFSTIKILFP